MERQFTICKYFLSPFLNKRPNFHLSQSKYAQTSQIWNKYILYIHCIVCWYWWARYLYIVFCYLQFGQTLTMAEYVFLAIRNAINKFMRHSRNNVTYTVFKSSNKRYLSILIMLDHLWCISEYDIVAATFWEHCYIFLYKVLYGSNYSSTSLRNTFSSNIYSR